MSPKPIQYRVRNWRQFQHYKDRNPPWIKLHFALLASEDWVMLDDASKLLAVVCMLVASRNEGMIPNNPAYLKRIAYLDSLPDLGPLISCGFIENPLADESGLQATARPETETDTEKKEEPTGSLSETSSDQPPKAKNRISYPEQFEAFWKSYPTTPNMSKSKALAGWKKLDEADRLACSAAVPGYRSFLKSKADHPTMHATTFINERRFEGFAAKAAPVILTETDWQKRLRYGRHEKAWWTKWGPAPGASGCLAPQHLLQPDDGADWRIKEETA